MGRDVAAGVAAVVCLAVLVGGTAVRAADCGGLKDLKLEATTITSAEAMSGTLTMTGEGTLTGLPAMCRVTGVMRPTSDSKIRFEVWLPAEGWNGRLLGTGNGGFAGSISGREMAGYLKRGFAVAGSDAGHQAESADATWAFGHPEKVKDFGWRAVHVMTARAKEIVAAERFPEDYDGILAGAPANAWSTLMASAVAGMQLLGDPRAYIPGGKLAAIEKASLDACDALDGVKDGVIGDPGKCKFDPEVLKCAGEDAMDCLTQPQIETLKTLYSGPQDGRGRTLFPGYSMGDETGWSVWVVGQAPESSAGAAIARSYFRYMVTSDPKWNAMTANLDAMVRLSREKMAADLDATNPDLSKFAARGGKLILYHGWDDPAIPPGSTVKFFKEVQQTMGAEKAADFVKLYMVPGMEHCIGGPGADMFGQLGTPTAKGSTFGVFDSLESWVEKGAPEEDLTSTKYGSGADVGRRVVKTRPLCAWPKVVTYKGSGDVNDAGSFVCGEP